MIAAIVDTAKLGKVILYSLLLGIGVVVVFGAGVSGAAGLLESLRQRRTGTAVAWGAVTVTCIVCTLGAVVFGVVVMTNKG